MFLRLKKSVVKSLYLVISHPVFLFHPQVKVKGEDITFALKVIKKKHVVDNRQQEHIHSERRILAEARSPFVVKSVPLLSSQTYFHFLSYTIKLCSISVGKQSGAY